MIRFYQTSVSLFPEPGNCGSRTILYGPAHAWQIASSVVLSSPLAVERTCSKSQPPHRGQAGRWTGRNTTGVLAQSVRGGRDDRWRGLGMGAILRRPLGHVDARDSDAWPRPRWRFKAGLRSCQNFMRSRWRSRARSGPSRSRPAAAITARCWAVSGLERSWLGIGGSLRSVLGGGFNASGGHQHAGRSGSVKQDQAIVAELPDRLANANPLAWG